MQRSVTPTVYRKNLKEKILEAAVREFRARGIKAVKMDDIANVLSISKRTLYEIYTNKEELLMACVKVQIEEFDQHMVEFIGNDDNVLHIFIEFYREKMRTLSCTSPLYFSDLHGYPSVLNWLIEVNRNRRKTTLEYYQDGLKQGYFRDDVDYELITEVMNASIDYVMSHQFYNKYSLIHLFNNVTFVYLRGICTIKGMQVLEEGLAQVQEELRSIQMNNCQPKHV